MHPLLRALLPILLALTPARAATVSVAAASNLTHVVGALNAAFAQRASGTTVTTTFGASGSLSAQIRAGAPFDVFLSADTDYPRKLADLGLADASTLAEFATGRLAFWTMREDLDVRDLRRAVSDPGVRKIAIAQPDTAPYGRAALAALEQTGLAAAARTKLVIGENIAQAAQFVETGNADAGFVALSLVKAGPLAGRGHWCEVPPALFPAVSLAHAGVITTHGRTKPAARAFMAFLQSDAGRAILQAHGYAVPTRN